MFGIDVLDLWIFLTLGPETRGHHVCGETSPYFISVGLTSSLCSLVFLSI